MILSQKRRVSLSSVAEEEEERKTHTTGPAPTGAALPILCSTPLPYDGTTLKYHSTP
jgi:hypothetical protein